MIKIREEEKDLILEVIDSIACDDPKFMCDYLEKFNSGDGEIDITMVKKSDKLFLAKKQGDSIEVYDAINKSWNKIDNESDIDKKISKKIPVPEEDVVILELQKLSNYFAKEMTKNVLSVTDRIKSTPPYCMGKTFYELFANNRVKESYIYKAEYYNNEDASIDKELIEKNNYLMQCFKLGESILKEKLDETVKKSKGRR